MNCVNCNQETKNPKFCCQSCSASFNNKLPRNRMKVKGKCKVCNEPIHSKRKYCDECFKTRPYTTHSKLSSLTKRCLRDMKSTNGYYTNHYTKVRVHARKVAVKNNMLSNGCSKCGWPHHVEVCHVIPINSFDDDIKIEVINHPSNLKILCPNCHWLYDNTEVIHSETRPISNESINWLSIPPLN